jgi:3-dehydroquinate dehydratase II
MKISIINGPNLNLLGAREPEVYGNETFETYLEKLKTIFPTIEFTYYDGIILNPGGYTHTSVALGDAVAAITTKVIEVHISNIFGREEFRKNSHVSAKCVGVISGLGLKGYELGVKYLLETKD